ncbi:hypothetical protein AVEN_219363-1 [Araneus ventricosus]|uniref:Uncharacterized protein n=1 Tax=Araneus ventricosus TaxID=182803 RepID=A0A4Y2BGL8_ARAVE|nr:hypothetical protein AVEN_219363-1 [Araneus ventricosus]
MSKGAVKNSEEIHPIFDRQTMLHHFEEDEDTVLYLMLCERQFTILQMPPDLASRRTSKDIIFPFHSPRKLQKSDEGFCIRIENILPILVIRTRSQNSRRPDNFDDFRSNEEKKKSKIPKLSCG